MLSVKEITEQAANALNEGFTHYFNNLASGESVLTEAQFIGELIQTTQPWLLFTEGSLEEMLTAKIHKNAEHLNLIYNLTMVFFSKFPVEEKDYNRYLDHLAFSYHVSAGERELSMMHTEHLDRLMREDAIRSLMENNRFMVMLATMFNHLNVAILADAAALATPK